MNEWVAFGVVAVICGLLALLARSSGNDDPPSADPPTDEAMS